MKSLRLCEQSSEHPSPLGDFPGPKGSNAPQPEAAEPIYITVAEAARLASVSERTLYRWASQDSSIPLLRVEGTVRIHKARWLRWLEDHVQGSRRRLSSGSLTSHSWGYFTRKPEREEVNLICHQEGNSTSTGSYAVAGRLCAPLASAEGSRARSTYYMPSAARSPAMALQGPWQPSSGAPAP
jgi:excisionase family DNA binding protein